MAATLSKSPCHLPQFLAARPNSVVGSSRANGSFLIVCKSQRNSRYEKSKKHARQGQATIPKEAPAVPSELRTKPRGQSNYPKPAEMEAREKTSATEVEQADTEEQSENLVVKPMPISASGSPEGSNKSDSKATKQSSGSHWDDFWAPRLFWVFRALGTVVD